jgi:hypothetical protein
MSVSSNQSLSVPAGEADPPAENGRKHRPFGLYAIIGIQVLMTLLSLTLILLIGLALWLTLEGANFGLGEMDLSLTLSPFEVGTLAMMAIVNPNCAVGMWRRQRWAWLLSMLQIGFFMLGDLYSYFTGESRESYGWSMLLNVAMVFYLNQRDVQALFLTHKEQQRR